MGKNRFQLKVSQKTSLSPFIRQSIEILSFSAQELTERLKREEENPFLKIENNPLYLSQSQSIEDAATTLADTRLSLQDYLLEQISELDLEEEVLKLLEEIISSLNSKGFTSQNHQFFFKNYTSPFENKIIAILKKLEPVGVCAENVFQSLEWQAEKKFPHAITLHDLIAILPNTVSSLTKELNREQLTALACKLGVAENATGTLFAELRQLNPWPAEKFTISKAQVAIPDILYHINKDVIKIEIREKQALHFSLDEDLYNRLKDETAKNKQEEESHKLWRQKYADASSLISALQFRIESLEKLAIFLLEKQKKFFISGPDFIVPLTLTEASIQLKIHLSTLSRLVSNKYFYCTWGQYTLRKLFSRGIRSNSGTITNEKKMKSLINNVIKSEKSDSPYSDEQISKILKKEGYYFARRTINKYRKLLLIPSAKERKGEIKN